MNRFIINGLSSLLVGLVIFFAERGLFRWVFTAVLAAIATIALWEYYRMVKKKGLFPSLGIGISIVILYIFAVFYKTQGPHFFIPSLWQHLPEIVLGLGFFGCFVFYAIAGVSPIVNIATTFLGVVYIGIPLGLIIRVVYFFTFGGLQDPLFEGSWWLLYLIVVTKSADMGGYFIGKSFGKRKLAFKLSPNKTLEGALGGLFSALFVSLLLIALGKNIGGVFFNFSYLGAATLGMITGIAGQLGDLAESLLKRDADVKDSNRIPGVGGVLDMVDSLLFASPVVYIFLRIHYT